MTGEQILTCLSTRAQSCNWRADSHLLEHIVVTGEQILFSLEGLELLVVADPHTGRRAAISVLG